MYKSENCVQQRRLVAVMQIEWQDHDLSNLAVVYVEDPLGNVVQKSKDFDHHDMPAYTG